MKVLFSILLILGSFACSGKSAEDVFAEIDKARDKNDVQAVLDGYQYLYDNFPKHEKRAIVVFQMGYLNHNYIKNLDLAKKYYQEFLKNFPKHELASSAQFELDNLGVPIEKLPFLQKVDSIEETDKKAKVDLSK